MARFVDINSYRALDLAKAISFVDVVQPSNKQIFGRPKPLPKGLGCPGLAGHPLYEVVACRSYFGEGVMIYRAVERRQRLLILPVDDYPNDAAGVGCGVFEPLPERPRVSITRGPSNGLQDAPRLVCR
jgi:hypothetical protein